MHMFLWVSVKENISSSDDVDLNKLIVNTSANRRCLLGCRIVNFLLNNFENYLKTNDIDEDTSKVVEGFREQRNQDEMAKFSNDDNTRALQRAIKKLVNVIDVNDLNISNKARNNATEDIENSRMNYAGENVD